MSTAVRATRPTLVVAHPSADLYGADLQLVQTVAAMTARGWEVVVAVAGDGPLLSLLSGAGARVVTMPFPVLRRSSSSPAGVARLAAQAAGVQPTLVGFLRAARADVLLVNTVTLPWWLSAAAVARVPAVCHVHEAEAADSALVRSALNAPLLLARRVVFNSRASRAASLSALPGLAGRDVLVYNGVPGPGREIAPADPARRPLRLALVSRLSPRKRCLDAIEATALLRERGRDVRLDVHGSTFTGYEWYEQQLRDRVAELGLGEHVGLHGYGSVWDALEQADVLLAPSSREPFGNVLVEAQLAGRPVVAAAAGGHLEIVDDAVTGRLVAPEDPQALAGGVEALMADPRAAADLADRARQEAQERFSVAGYGARIAEVLQSAAGDPPGRR